MSSIKVVVLLLIIISVPFFASRMYRGLPKYLRDYQLASSEYSVSIRSIYDLQRYYTFSPLDDVVITKDGKEKKYAFSLTNPTNYSFLSDLTWLFSKAREFKFSNEDGVGLNYWVSMVGDDSIVIDREYENLDVEMVGIGRSFLFNSEDQILLDRQPINRPSSLEKSQIVETEGVSELLVLHGYETKAISLILEEDDQVVIDWRFNLITIKDYDLNGENSDEQLIKLVEIY